MSDIFGVGSLTESAEYLYQHPQIRKEPLMEIVVRYRIGQEPEPHQRTRRIRFVDDYSMEKCEDHTYLKIDFYDHDHEACRNDNDSECEIEDPKSLCIAPDIIAEVEEVFTPDSITEAEEV